MFDSLQEMECTIRRMAVDKQFGSIGCPPSPGDRDMMRYAAIVERLLDANGGEWTVALHAQAIDEFGGMEVWT